MLECDYFTVMNLKRFLGQDIALMNTAYVQLDSKWDYSNVISPYHRIYYIDGGEGTITDPFGSMKLEAGYLYLVPNYTLCNLKCESSLSQYYVQFFEQTTGSSSLFGSARSVLKVVARELDVLNFHRLVEINPNRGLNRSDDPKIYEKNIYYKQYTSLNDLQKPADFLETQGILLQLISKFFLSEMFQTKKMPMPMKIMDAIHFIMINLPQQLSVDMLAERCNLNRQYFSRLFQRHTGTLPQSYIMEKRIERAKHMMRSGGSDFTRVAEITGFQSLSSFSRSFKKQTGLSPSQFYASILVDSDNKEMSS